MECCYALRTQMAADPIVFPWPEQMSVDDTMCRWAKRLKCPGKRGPHCHSSRTGLKRPRHNQTRADH